MASPAPYSSTDSVSIGFIMACPQSENTRSTFLTGEYEAANATTGSSDAASTGNIEGSTQVPFVHNAQGRGTNGAIYTFDGESGAGTATEGCNQGLSGPLTCTTTEGATLLAAVQAGLVAYGD